jgi:acetate---CoA ligase (ADP-forming)
LLRQSGIGVRHAHATGNDSDVTLAELALAVVQDPGVRLLLLYVESIRDPEMLARAAALARERDIPIVALKTGRTARGQAAARSHTGALASEDRVVNAFFERHGIWRVRDVHELVSAAGAYLKGWRPRSNRLVVVSNSGASCVMAADTAHDLNLDLTSLQEDTVTRLAGQLPSFATATNPIDITAALLTDSQLFGRILTVLADDPNIDSLFVAVPVLGAGYDVPALATAASDYASSTGKVVIVATPQENVATQFRAAGVPTFANQTEALAVVAQLTQHARLLRRPAARHVEAWLQDLPAGTSPVLSEAESLTFLHAQGMPTVEFRLCHHEGEARAAFRHFGCPVAVKACSSAIPHKSDQGLVILDARDEAAVASAYRDLQSRLSADGVEASVIVAPMVASRREFLLGAKVDPLFGPVLMIGAGGRYVEAIDDIALLLAPASAEEVRESLLGLRIAPLLAGLRGEPALDVDALCATAVRLGEIIVAFKDSIRSIDLNPVMVGSAASGVVIADALIERMSPPSSDGSHSAGEPAIGGASLPPAVTLEGCFGAAQAEDQ